MVNLRQPPGGALCSAADQGEERPRRYQRPGGEDDSPKQPGERLAVAAEGDVANCSVTEYAFQPSGGSGGKLALQRYNFVAPLTRGGATVTSEPDANVAVR